jgi:protein TonB
MNKTTLTILLLAFTIICYGQTTETKYFNSSELDKEVPQKKAKFSQTITQNTDGTITTDVNDLEKGEIVRSETYKGNEPYGIWKYRLKNSFKTIDYNFPLIYSHEKCNDSIPNKITDFFQDNDSLGYKAPKISTGEMTIYQFISKNIIYPTRARDAGIQGMVYLQLTLTKEGTFDNIAIKRGTNILLDKEAVRVLKQLKFSSTPTVYGHACTFKCITIPIKYRLM